MERVVRTQRARRATRGLCRARPPRVGARAVRRRLAVISRANPLRPASGRPSPSPSSSPRHAPDPRSGPPRFVTGDRPVWPGPVLRRRVGSAAHAGIPATGRSPRRLWSKRPTEAAGGGAPAAREHAAATRAGAPGGLLGLVAVRHSPRRARAASSAGVPSSSGAATAFGRLELGGDQRIVLRPHGRSTRRMSWAGPPGAWQRRAGGQVCCTLLEGLDPWERVTSSLWRSTASVRALAGPRKYATLVLSWGPHAKTSSHRGRGSLSDGQRPRMLSGASGPIVRVVNYLATGGGSPQCLC
jgi:hypothetical protein